MRINALYGLNHAYYENSRPMPISRNKITSVIDINSLRPQNFSAALSFGAGTSKNVAQVASIAPEYQGILNGIYKKGGLGNVAGEAAVAFADEGGLDIRTFVPYYSADNETGGVRLMVADSATREEISKGATLEKLQGKVEFKTVSPDYQLNKNGNESFILQQKINKLQKLSRQI